MSDLGINPDFAREWAFKPFVLIDVNQIPDEELAQHKWAALFELMQKHSRERDMLPFLEKLFKGQLSLEVHQYGDLLYLMVQYLAETGEISDKRKFVELLKQSLPEGEKEMTTLAQDWLQEGKQIGYIEGKLEGETNGEHKAKILVVKNMLANGFTYDVIEKITGMSAKEIAKFVH